MTVHLVLKSFFNFFLCLFFLLDLNYLILLELDWFFFLFLKNYLFQFRYLYLFLYILGLYDFRLSFILYLFFNHLILPEKFILQEIFILRNFIGVFAYNISQLVYIKPISVVAIRLEYAWKNRGWKNLINILLGNNASISQLNYHFHSLKQSLILLVSIRFVIFKGSWCVGCNVSHPIWGISNIRG